MLLKDLINNICRKNPNTLMTINIPQKTYRMTTAERLMHSEIYAEPIRVKAFSVSKNNVCVACYENNN